MIFARRHGTAADGTRTKHYYVPESVGIATGMLITALHMTGLYCLTHSPNPMKFLKALCHRPDNEKPVMILAVGRPAPGATGPAAARDRKPLSEGASFLDRDRAKGLSARAENALSTGGRHEIERGPHANQLRKRLLRRRPGRL